MDVVTLGMAKADAKKKFDMLGGVGLKRAVYAAGTPGTGTTITLDQNVRDTANRLVVRLPVTTKRWRLKLRNYDNVTNTAHPSFTGKGVRFGLDKPSSFAGQETGQYATGSTLVVSGTYTIPGNGAWYTSPWIEDVGQQFQAHTRHIVSHAYNGTVGATIPRGTGQSFTSDAAGFFEGTVNASSSWNTPFDVLVEYEFEGDHRIGVFIGDSLMEGNGGGIPIYHSWPAMWAERSRSVAINLGVTGSLSSSWRDDYTRQHWTRVDFASYSPDFAVLSLGGNDIASDVTRDTWVNNMRGIVGNIRAKIGADKPIYLANTPPRTLSTERESLRTQYNTFTAEAPFGVAGIFDMDAALRDPAAPTVMLLRYDSGDLRHPNRLGYAKMAETASGRLA